MITIANWIANIFMLGISLLLLGMGIGLLFIISGIIIKEIKENNPVLYSLLETVSFKKDDDYAKGYIIGASQFYSLIKRQIEADFLDRYL